MFDSNGNPIEQEGKDASDSAKYHSTPKPPAKRMRMISESSGSDSDTADPPSSSSVCDIDSMDVISDVSSASDFSSMVKTFFINFDILVSYIKMFLLIIFINSYSFQDKRSPLPKVGIFDNLFAYN